MRSCYDSMHLFFFNDTATTEIYTLSLHDALPIWSASTSILRSACSAGCSSCSAWSRRAARRSEEHTSELQSRQYLVCRLLLEKKKTIGIKYFVVLTISRAHVLTPVPPIPPMTYSS